MNTKQNTLNQQAYRERKQNTHIQRQVWLEKDVNARLVKLAKAKGWLAKTGCHAGSVNYQRAITEALEAGLSTLGA